MQPLRSITKARKQTQFQDDPVSSVQIIPVRLRRQRHLRRYLALDTSDFNLHIAIIGDSDRGYSNDFRELHLSAIGSLPAVMWHASQSDTGMSASSCSSQYSTSSSCTFDAESSCGNSSEESWSSSPDTGTMSASSLRSILPELNELTRSFNSTIHHILERQERPLTILSTSHRQRVPSSTTTTATECSQTSVSSSSSSITTSPLVVISGALT